MPTLQIQTEVTPQMVTQMVQSMTEAELRELERELKIEQLRRFCPDVPQEETALLQRALQPPPHEAHLEELLELREEGTLSEEQHAELIQIVEEREADNVERVAVVGRLALLRGEKFEALWKKLGLVPKGRHRVTG